jgi:hypothetical protein
MHGRCLLDLGSVHMCGKDGDDRSCDLVLYCEDIL